MFSVLCSFASLAIHFKTYFNRFSFNNAKPYVICLLVCEKHCNCNSLLLWPLHSPCHSCPTPCSLKEHLILCSIKKLWYSRIAVVFFFQRHCTKNWNPQHHSCFQSPCKHTMKRQCQESLYQSR